jgi:hypothetical protein
LENRQMFSLTLHTPVLPSAAFLQASSAISTEYSATAHETDAYGTNVQSLLGKATSGVVAVPGVSGAYVETFHDSGAIYYSPTTGAHVVYGAIGDKYAAVNGPTALGLPINDEATTPDGVGRYNHFESVNGKSFGAIDWTSNYGAHAVLGNVATEFKKVGWEKIGEATTDEIDIVNGSYIGEYNRFATEATVTLPIGGGTFLIPTKTSAVNWTNTNGGSLTAGPSYTDITQGSNGTCWIDASMAAMEASGTDLASLITYDGNNTYSVQVNNYNNPGTPSAGTHPETETVVFNGTTLGPDAAFNQADPSQSWALIMQRAVIQALHDWDPSETIQNPHSGGAGDAQAILTGRVYNEFGTSGSTVQQTVESDLANHETVVLDTSATTSTLVNGHYYAVLSANANGVTLYNPWGLGLASRNPGGTDPFTVSWSVVAQDGNIFSAA